MSAIAAIARERRLRLVEDCAQALGAAVGTIRAGQHGDLAAFSFYPTKNLGALGDGGAVVTSDPELESRVRQLRHYGENSRRLAVRQGLNSRLDEIQAAVLRARLRRLSASNDRRREIARRYDAGLAETQIRPIGHLPGFIHAYCYYVIRTPERDAFATKLQRRGVMTKVHYPQPIHGHPLYRGLSERGTDLSHSERLSTEVLSLPLYPELSEDEIEYVIAEVRRAVGSR
jgi:dTDP-4-amino-4,6-dideoxygalactose transaminase